MEIIFGCLAPSISIQLKKQNICYDTKTVKTFDCAHTMLCKLKFMDLFQLNQIDKAYDRLYKQIEKHVWEQNGGLLLQ